LEDAKMLLGMGFFPSARESERALTDLMMFFNRAESRGAALMALESNSKYLTMLGVLREQQLIKDIAAGKIRTIASNPTTTTGTDGGSTSSTSSTGLPLINLALTGNSSNADARLIGLSTQPNSTATGGLVGVGTGKSSTGLGVLGIGLGNSSTGTGSLLGVGLGNQSAAQGGLLGIGLGQGSTGITGPSGNIPLINSVPKLLNLPGLPASALPPQIQPVPLQFDPTRMVSITAAALVDGTAGKVDLSATLNQTRIGTDTTDGKKKG
jgi:hypothetical protein